MNAVVDGSEVIMGEWTEDLCNCTALLHLLRRRLRHPSNRNGRLRVRGTNQRGPHLLLQRQPRRGHVLCLRFLERVDRPNRGMRGRFAASPATPRLKRSTFVTKPTCTAASTRSPSWAPRRTPDHSGRPWSRRCAAHVRIGVQTGAPSDYFLEDPANPLTLTRYHGSGTAHLKGAVLNADDPSISFDVDIYFESEQNAAEWLEAQSGADLLSQNDCDIDAAQMQVYTLKNTMSRLVGTGSMAGELLPQPHACFPNQAIPAGRRGQQPQLRVRIWRMVWLARCVERHACVGLDRRHHRRRHGA